MRYMYIVPAKNGRPIVNITDEIKNMIEKWKTTGDKIIMYSDKLIDELLRYKDIEVIDTISNKPVPHKTMMYSTTNIKELISNYKIDAKESAENTTSLVIKPKSNVIYMIITVQHPIKKPPAPKPTESNSGVFLRINGDDSLGDYGWALTQNTLPANQNVLPYYKSYSSKAIGNTTEKVTAGILIGYVPPISTGIFNGVVAFTKSYAYDSNIVVSEFTGYEENYYNMYRSIGEWCRGCIFPGPNSNPKEKLETIEIYTEFKANIDVRYLNITG